jgi:CcmD family protein
MGDALYLFYAFRITWAVLFIYVFSILKRQRSLERELDKVKEILEKI